MAQISVEISNIPLDAGVREAVRERLREVLIACAGTKMRSKISVLLGRKTMVLGGGLSETEQSALARAVVKAVADAIGQPIEAGGRKKVHYTFTAESRHEELEQEIAELEFRILEAELGADHFGHNAAAVSLATQEAAMLREKLKDARERLDGLGG